MIFDQLHTIFLKKRLYSLLKFLIIRYYYIFLKSLLLKINQEQIIDVYT